MKSGSRPLLTNRASEGAWEGIRRRDWIFWKAHSILLLETLVSTPNNARASASSGRNTIEWKIQIRLSSQQWMKHLEISILPLLSSSAYINHWIHMILSIQFSRNCMYQSSTSSSISKSLKAFLISDFCFESLSCFLDLRFTCKSIKKSWGLVLEDCLSFSGFTSIEFLLIPISRKSIRG